MLKNYLIERIKEKFDVYIFPAIEENLIELRFSLSDIELEIAIIFNESICEINYERFLSIDMDKEYRYHDIYFSCIILQQLYQVAYISPDCVIWENNDEYQITIGYTLTEWDINIILKYLTLINNINIDDKILNKRFLLDKYPELFKLYLKTYHQKLQEFNELMLKGWSYNNKYKNIKEFENIHIGSKEDLYLFMSASKKIIVGMSEESLYKIVGLFDLKQHSIDDIYLGVKYCVAHVDGRTLTWDIALVKDAAHIIDCLSLTSKMSAYSYCFHQFLIIKCLEL